MLKKLISIKWIDLFGIHLMISFIKAGTCMAQYNNSKLILTQLPVLFVLSSHGLWTASKCSDYLTLEDVKNEKREVFSHINLRFSFSSGPIKYRNTSKYNNTNNSIKRNIHIH
jgi:hypothetical protein